MSLSSEPANHKVLEVGTTSYRAPETLFGNRSYDTSLDIWASGTMLVECLRTPPTPLFESRESHEDGNQLGLILSIFKTLGTPTKKSWPEAEKFSTPPFEWYTEFPGKKWEELLEGVEEEARELVGKLVRYESCERLGPDEVCVYFPLLRGCFVADYLRYRLWNMHISSKRNKNIPECFIYGYILSLSLRCMTSTIFNVLVDAVLGLGFTKTLEGI